jgi:multiple sugar transport system permease protein
VGLIFSWFYAPDFGFLPKVIGFFTGTEVAILADDRFATYGVIAAGLWPQIAYCMILYLTGLNNINPEQVKPREWTTPRVGRCFGTSSFHSFALPPSSPW